ncbi:MAG: alpha/beta hydrolase [Terracidiphilus sp.]
MTMFLDVRALWGSGGVSDSVQLMEWVGGVNFADPTQYKKLKPDDLLNHIHGRDVLIAAHGFNVNRIDGIRTFYSWEKVLSPTDVPVFLGLLWPGDSESLHALSYPMEPRNAMAAGSMIADFIDNNLQDAASISLVSHSLGARVVLQTAAKMNRNLRRLILMAGAVSDDSLTAEFASVPNKVEKISLLASMKDEVLRWAFPIGDLVSELVDRDHPWWESALGRTGARVRPANYLGPCQIPDPWNFGHGNYLQVKPPAPAVIPCPIDIPQIANPLPINGMQGWQPAWSASFVSTRFR